MTLRPEPGSRHPGYPQSDGDRARNRALERSYPLAKQLAEILELEAIEPLAGMAKNVRQAIGVALAEIGSSSPRRDDDDERAAG